MWSLVWYYKSIILGSHKMRGGICLSEKRKDNKGRLLRMNEIQMKGGRYRYKYFEDGEERYLYSWKLVSTDKAPSGKRDELSLREKEEILQNNVRNGLQAKPKKTTLNQVFRRHMEIKKYARSTKENYEYMWDRFLKKSDIAKRDVTGIKKSDILRFYKKLSDGGLADGTIQAIHKMIYPSLQLAVDDDIIVKNPAYGCCDGYNKQKYKKEALTEKQQESFLEELPLLSKRRKYNLLFRVMLGTAMRIGEIMGLRWNDVDMNERIINIDHEVLYRKVDGKMQFYVESTKSKSGERVLPMTDDVYECFVELYKNKHLHPSTIIVDGYTNFVFTSRAGKPLYPANINKGIGALVDKYNAKYPEAPLPNITNHIFRHTGCTRMAENEVEIGTLQYFMGHGDIKMIRKVYDHVSIDRVRKQLQKMNKPQTEAKVL